MSEPKNKERLEQEVEEITRAVLFGIAWIVFFVPCLLWVIHLSRRNEFRPADQRAAYIGATATLGIALLGGLPFLINPELFSYPFPMGNGISFPAGYPCLWIASNFGMGTLFYLFLPHWRRLKGKTAQLRDELF